MKEIKLSTKLEYPQISEIFKNWKMMSTWGKERLVYENESKKIQCFIRLNLIDTINKFLNFEILCLKEKHQQYIFNPKFNIPIRGDMTQKIFENKIISKVFSCLEDCELKDIRNLDKANELFNEYTNKREKLVFDYYNSQVLKKNKLLNIKDVTYELIQYYTSYEGKLYKQDSVLYKPYHDFINSQRHKLWKDIYKHFISLIPYEDLREKYTNIINEDV